MAAIYMWYWDAGIVFTTTLYPIESKDAVTFSVSFDSGYLHIPEEDSWQWTQSVISGDLVQSLLTMPQQSDEWKWTQSVLSGDLIQSLQIMPTQEDEWKWVMSALSGDLLLALVKVNTQTDGMTFAVSFAGGTLT